LSVPLFVVGRGLSFATLLFCYACSRRHQGTALRWARSLPKEQRTANQGRHAKRSFGKMPSSFLVGRGLSFAALLFCYACSRRHQGTALRWARSLPKEQRRNAKLITRAFWRLEERISKSRSKLDEAYHGTPKTHSSFRGTLGKTGR